MSTAENGGTGIVASAEPSVTLQPSTNAPEPAAKGKSDDDISMPKAAFNARLDQARSSLLKDLGVDNIEAAKAAIAAAKAADDAKKSDGQKLAEYEAKLASSSASLDSLTKTVAAFAQTQMSGLTEAQRAAVTNIAGDDPSKQLSTIEALKPTWASAPAAIQAPVIANTAPPPKAAPSDHGTPVATTVDHKAVYEELRNTNPVLAARYAHKNGVFNPTK